MVSVFQLIGWKGDRCFQDQSQSEVKQIQCSPRSPSTLNRKLSIALIDIIIFRPIFNWVSKVIRPDCFSVTQRCFVIGPGNSRHPLNQSDAKAKIQSRLGRRVFPRSKQSTSFHFEFSLPNDNLNLYSDWSFG